MRTNYPDLLPDAPRRAQPLHCYGALGDGRSVALVTPDGVVAWWCVPNIDSDPLLDPAEGGFFALQPAEPFRAERAYRLDSNVLETTFTTAGGAVRVTESMNSTLAGRLPWCELARRVDGLSGTVAMQARIVFGTRAGTVSPWLQPTPNGCVFHARPVLGVVRATANVRVVEDDRSIAAFVTLRAGERAVLAVVAGEDQPLGVPGIGDVDARIEISDGAWRAWAWCRKARWRCNG